MPETAGSSPLDPEMPPAPATRDHELACGIRGGHVPRGFYVRHGKRVLDLIGALALLVVLGPLIAVLALIVRTTSGPPVFFRQERVGQNGTRFRIFKFRTMIPDAVHQGAGLYVADHDERVTWAGRWLRATSMDELPQLFNVLCGDMSLVGPRPNLPVVIERYRPYYELILTVKPGVTGLAAVRGRSKLRRSQMLALDQEYARSVGLFTDLGLLVASVPAVLLRRGAVGGKTAEYMEDLDTPPADTQGTSTYATTEGMNTPE